MMHKPTAKPPYRLFRPWDRVPELQQFSPRMRYEIWERANAAGRLGCAATVFLFSWIMIVADLYRLSDGSYWNDSQLESYVTEYKGMLIIGTIVIAPLVLIPLQQSIGRRKVRDWLVRTQMYSRAPACLACGYSLIGTTAESEQCPECGKPIPKGKTPESLPR